jgi:hypothetical protein
MDGKERTVKYLWSSPEGIEGAATFVSSLIRSGAQRGWVAKTGPDAAVVLLECKSWDDDCRGLR